MSTLGIVLTVILVLILLGALGGGSVVPYWSYGYGYNHGGVGIVGILLIVLLIAAMTGHI